MKSVVLGRKSVAIFKRVDLTETVFERMRGLLGRESYPPDRAMWLEPCSSIHTFCMRFSIDVYFLDRDMTVVNVQRNVKPGRMVLGGASSCSVLETSAGALEESAVTAGDCLECI